MKIRNGSEEIEREGSSVVTVGTFDGVHLAHREIIREVTHRARMIEGRSVVVTFDPHPKEVVPSTRQGDVKLLTTVRERAELLAECGIDELVVIPFTEEFSRQSAREFAERTLVRRIGAAEVVVGYDHMFGRGRSAGTEELVGLGKEFNFSVFAVHPYTVDGEPVSSTRIRRALAGGDLERAQAMLGYRYRFSGRVVRGDRRGVSIGFPTANITPESLRKVIPARGVYVVAVEEGGRTLFGMMNIGVRPTVTAGFAETIEVHCFDFAGDLYGASLRVTFLARLRDEQKFASLTELVEQLRRDREDSLRLLKVLEPQFLQRTS